MFNLKSFLFFSLSLFFVFFLSLFLSFRCLFSLFLLSLIYFLSDENQGLMELTQPSQPLLSILNLSNTKISVFPEVMEFIIILYVFALRTSSRLMRFSSKKQ